MGERLLRYWTFILNAFAAAALACLVILVVASTVDIVSRFAFNSPLSGLMLIITDLLFPAMVFFSAGYMSRNNGHVRVDFLHNNLPERQRLFADRCFALLIALFWALIMYTAADRALEAIIRNFRPNAVFGIPIYISFGVVALGGLIAVIESIIEVFRPQIIAREEDSHE